MSQNITNGPEKIRIKPGKLVKLGAFVAPAICLGYSLVVLALSSKPIPLWLWVVEFFVVAIVVAVSIWAVCFMRVEIEKDISSYVVTIKAPFYSRTVSCQKISDTSVGEDSGMNSGVINWPVTGRAHSRNGGSYKRRWVRPCEVCSRGKPALHDRDGRHESSRTPRGAIV